MVVRASRPLPDARGSAIRLRSKEIYEALHPEATAGAVRAAGMNKALGNNVAAKSAATFTAATAKATGKEASFPALERRESERLK
ncbi:hypothetical protein [Methylocystis sp. B8]|uniref:hypothetical protein n=1 Tax=Methylocystis sp. B8 TaxID=544938 RepID=UPI0010FEF55C|nr:hypothetical protein [Methylocystis sp. B8]TLG71838.1 hypothetical protein FEV16_15190 [Methylocystis sp. B8]